MSDFDVLCLKIFNDNYVWLVVNNKNNYCIIVDPGEFENLSEFIKSQNLIPAAVLVTHHHKDHCGGLTQVKNKYNIPVFGYVRSDVLGITHYVDDNDVINLEDAKMQFSVITLPGHTLDHVAYVFESSIFCGDTLFSGGCGKVFEGTYEQMFTSLNKIKELHDDTKIYCSHEYTLSNLLFACEIDRENQHLMDYICVVKKKIEQGSGTIPSTLGLEKKINPFLRCDDVDFINALKKSKNIEFSNSLEVFKYIRELKNNFNMVR